MIYVFAFGMQHTHPIWFSPSHLQARKHLHHMNINKIYQMHQWSGAHDME